MKLINGWYLPDSDQHFEFHLTRGPQIEGRGTYQWSKIIAALNLVSNDRRFVALDIGAHVGLWTVPLARFFGQVTAWEPVPELNACWRRNCSNIPNVALRSAALGDTAGVMPMAAPGDNSGNWRVAAGEELHVVVKDQAGLIQFPVERLDDCSFQVVDFMKIDVEGYEFQVITGGEELIRHSKPIIVVEQKPGNAEVYGRQQLDAVKLLESWGAKIAWVKSGDYCLTW